ncbi:MAG: DDE-type integrase/transposase/recombinase [Planctomycetes bacterium]|nr:DDE-type integrase/transposase/recombinase [Planctomycetota bacterium]
MDERQCEEMALFRYGVIGDLVSRPLAAGEKQKVLERLAGQEWRIPGTDRTRVAVSTIREWVDLYRGMGFDGLKPVPRADAGTSRVIPDEVVDLLLALRKERPKASLDSLVRAARLAGKIPPDLRLSRSTVYRLLARHGAVTAVPAAEADAMAFTHPHANDLWTSDLMHGPRLEVPGRRDGGKAFLYAFLDDASRVVPYAAFYLAENAACFQDAFKQAILRRGVPRRLYTDNGATYRTHHLEVICATLNVTLVHSRPYRPRGRGKVERFFRHVRTAFLPHVTPAMLADLASLNRVWWAWLEGEYHQTPHSGLDGKTPLDRFMEDQALLRPAPDDLDALMRMKIARRVGRDRTVRIDGRLYEAPDGYASETVDVLYDPYDPARTPHLRRRNTTEEVPLRRIDLAVNASLHRHPREVDPGEPPAPTGISYLDLVARSFYGEGR